MMFSAPFYISQPSQYRRLRVFVVKADMILFKKHDGDMDLKKHDARVEKQIR